MIIINLHPNLNKSAVAIIFVTAQRVIVQKMPLNSFWLSRGVRCIVVKLAKDAFPRNGRRWSFLLSLTREQEE